MLRESAIAGDGCKDVTCHGCEVMCELTFPHVPIGWKVSWRCTENVRWEEVGEFVGCANFVELDDALVVGEAFDEGLAICCCLLHNFFDKCFAKDGVANGDTKYSETISYFNW